MVSTSRSGIPNLWRAGRWRRAGFLPVLSLALLFRLLWALLVPVRPVSDGATYDLFARNLVAGLGYGFDLSHPTAYWPVGTSFLYSIFYRVFGFSYTPILVFNLVISCPTIWLTMLLAERWFNRRVAIVTGYGMALWPMQIEFVSLLSSELIFNFLLVVWLYLWDKPVQKDGRHPRLSFFWKALGIGTLAAAASYIRPVALVLPFMLSALEMARTRKYLAPIKSTALVYLVMAMLIAPWSIRNTRVFGQFIPISTNYGANLWMGNHDIDSGETVDIPPEAFNMPEVERDHYLRRLAIDYIEQHPARFVLRTLVKAVRLHSHETIGIHWNMPGLVSVYGERVLWPLKLISNLFWWAMLLLGLGGVVLIYLQQGIWMLLKSPAFMIWYYFTALYSILVVQDRYHFSSTPFIAILAAVLLVAIGQWISEHQRMRDWHTESSFTS
jgi:hypothetical protein